MRGRRARHLVLLIGLPTITIDARAAEPMAVTLAADTQLPVTLMLASDPPTTDQGGGAQVVEPGGYTPTPLANPVARTTELPPPILKPKTRVPQDTRALAGEERAPVSAEGTPTVPAGAGPEAVPLPYSITINGIGVGDATLLQLRDGRLLASQTDLARWRVMPPPATQFLLQGDSYYPLDSVPGFRAVLDATRQRADLTFSPAAFKLTRLAVASLQQTIATKPQAFGAFFNYDLLGSHSQGFGSPDSNSLAGFGEFAAFDTWGSLVTNFAATNLAADHNAVDGGERKFVRLDSTYTRDDPSTLRTLIIGDTIGGASLIGRPVRLGGIRYARDFSTQPGFLVYPQPALTGEAALPSVVDVYLNGVRQQTQRIAPGPFQLDAVPSINGQGQVQLVVRDLLGREQVISQSYFTGARQLAKGLTDFSYEAGFLRRNLGTKDSDYANLAAIGTQRYGFTDNFTGEARVEFLDNGLQGGGIGGTYGIYPLGVFTAAGAASHSSAGSGGQALLGFNRVVRRNISFGFQYVASTPNYRVVGLDQRVSPPERQFTANANLSLARFGGLGIGYFNVKTRGDYLGTNSSVAGSTFISDTSNSSNGQRLTTEFYTASYSTSYHGIGGSFVLTRRVEPTRDLSVQVRGILPLDNRRYLSTNYTYQKSDTGQSTGLVGARFQQGLPSDLGVGYNVEVRQAHGDFADNDIQVDAGAALNAKYASSSIDVSHRDDGNAFRATVGGSIGTFAGHNFATRRIGSSFALVETGIEGIDLTVQNQPAARTDAAGVAVLPFIQAYNLNRVQVDPTNLPINVVIPNDTVDAVPYFRAGVLISMPATITHTAIATLVRPNGKTVPAGATLTVAGAVNPVGRKGLVYISSVTPGVTTGVATWGVGQRCTVTLTVPDNADFQYDLGALTCQEPAK